MKNIDETKNYFIEEINQNELMSKKHKKSLWGFDYIDHLIFSVSTVSGYVSISVFSSLVGVPVGITSSAIGLIICVITARIKKRKSIIKKKKKKHDKIVLLAKSY